MKVVIEAKITGKWNRGRQRIKETVNVETYKAVKDLDAE